eukprot:g10354.t1
MILMWGLASLWRGQSPGSCPKPRIEVNRPRPGSRTPSCGRASPAGSKTQKAVAAEWREMLARPFDRMPRFVPLRQEIGSRPEKTPIPQAFQTGFPQNFKSLKEDKSLQEPKQKNFESLEGSKARRTDKQSMQASQDEIEEAWRRPVSEFPTMSVTDSAATTHAAQEEALGTATTQTPTSFSGTCSPSKVSNSLQEPTEKKVEGGGKSSERIVEEGNFSCWRSLLMQDTPRVEPGKCLPKTSEKRFCIGKIASQLEHPYQQLHSAWHWLCWLKVRRNGSE